MKTHFIILTLYCYFYNATRVLLHRTFLHYDKGENVGAPELRTRMSVVDFLNLVSRPNKEIATAIRNLVDMANPSASLSLQQQDQFVLRFNGLLNAGLGLGLTNDQLIALSTWLNSCHK